MAAFINNFGNPLLFFHHYANPKVKPHLFEHKDDAKWFAHCCAAILAKCPQVTHVCPISQPIGFSQRVTRQTLPPFHIDIKKGKYVEHIVQAQVLASRAMKKVNPAIHVLVSHQWKPMKPLHGMTDPRYPLECLVSKIAHEIYNGGFVNSIEQYMKHAGGNDFDGIALSVYPGMKFDLWKPSGDNCAGAIDYQSSLEAMLETSAAFPDEDIYVVEAGCNSNDPKVKTDYIDMMLHACKVARDKDVPVKGLYFWGVTNDPDFYSEWGRAKGTTNFAPFDKLDPKNPAGSINAGGKHMQEILGQNK